MIMGSGGIGVGSQNIPLGALGAIAGQPPQTPMAFAAPILMEDGSVRAVVVDGNWRKEKDPRPLLTMEQAEAVVKMLNEAYVEQMREEQKRLVSQQEALMEQYKNLYVGTNQLIPTPPFDTPDTRSLFDKLTDYFEGKTK